MPIDPELREAVARAIVARRNLPDGSYVNWPMFHADADAAIALVVARCAEVAEAKAEAWWTDPTEKHYRTASEEIADEIRALASGARTHAD